MPTASQYESTAQLLRNQAWSYHDMVALTPRHPAARITDAVAVASTIDGQYHGVLQKLSAAAGELDDAAAECDRRAAVCRAYRRALNRYWSMPDDVRRYQPYPQRPAPWADG